VRISVSDIKLYEHSISVRSRTDNMRTDRQTDGRTDGVTKMIDSFRDFANRLKMNIFYLKKLYFGSIKRNGCFTNPTACTGECGKAFDRFL